MSSFHLGDLQLSSSAFEHGSPLPTRYTTEGTDVSPPLEWTNVPEGTQSFIVICHDPDAPLTYGFTHWVMYGIGGDVRQVEEGGGSRFVEGRHDFGSDGYLGPAPPPGHGLHHYFFHLYALGTELQLESGLTRSEVLRRADEDIIEQARIVGTFMR